MKTLELIDEGGNGAAYELCLPDGLAEWKVSGLFEFLQQPLEQARRNGFLGDAPDRLRHETLRRLVAEPLSCLSRRVAFVQGNQVLEEEDLIDLSAAETQLIMIRDDRAPMGNPLALSLTACNRWAFEGAREEIIRIIDGLVDFKQTEVLSLTGWRIASLAEIVDDWAATLSAEMQLKLVYRLAEVIYSHPFENVSKLLSGVPFCSGWEMWGRMHAGGGGICAEKSGALKFVLDVLGVETFYVAASQYTIPEEFERQLKQYVRSEGQEPVPVWIQHLLVGFRLNGEELLTDVSNGNLPLLFITGDDLQRYLAGGYRARMVYSVEQMQLKRISNWAGDALLTIGEFHAPGLVFQYIFKQALGLHISSQAYVGVFYDWGGEQSARNQGHYTLMAQALGLPAPRFVHADNLMSVPDEGLRETLAQALEALWAQQGNPYYTGDFTFVIQPLSGDRWKRPRISESIAERILE